MRSYLKKISWLLLLFTIFQPLVAGSDRKTDVYYSNGIYTVYVSAKCAIEMSAQCSRDRLYDKLKDENFTGTNISMLDEDIVDEAVILQYNWSQRQRCEDRKDKSHFCADKDAVMGYDLLETYYQLKASGQIDRALTRERIIRRFQYLEKLDGHFFYPIRANKAACQTNLDALGE